MLDQRRRGFAGGIRRKYDESDTGGFSLLVPAVLLALLVNEALIGLFVRRRSAPGGRETGVQRRGLAS